MAHGDAVIDGDGVEFLGDAARRLDLARHHLAEILQMHMARHELGEGIDHRDDGLAEIAILHAGGAPQAARAGHVAAMGGGAGTKCGMAFPFDFSREGRLCLFGLREPIHNRAARVHARDFGLTLRKSG